MITPHPTAAPCSGRGKGAARGATLCSPHPETLPAPWLLVVLCFSARSWWESFIFFCIDLHPT